MHRYGEVGAGAGQRGRERCGVSEKNKVKPGCHVSGARLETRRLSSHGPKQLDGQKKDEDDKKGMEREPAGKRGKKTPPMKRKRRRRLGKIL